MTDVRLFLFDDQLARHWAPFTLTRPVGELLFGCLSLRARAEMIFGLPCEGHLSRSSLADFDEPGAPRGLAPDDVGHEGIRILLSSRAVIDFQHIDPPSGGTRIFVGGEPAGWILSDGEPLPSVTRLRDPGAETDGGERMELDGYLIGRPWDLIEKNCDRIAADVEHLWADDAAPAGVIRIGDGIVSLGQDAVIEPGVHIDLRNGPIRLDDGARVEGPARLTGPLFIGRGSTVLGGAVGTSSVGTVCLVRGEVSHSVFLDFVNKAHDGYIGHALLGRWVNLGAFTTNSDLKNNYRPVHVWTPGGKQDTGMLKVGCFAGDHVKSGIGTVLNTGTVIGAGSNLFGGTMPPTVVPPFSWGVGGDLRDHRLDKFLATAERAMARRGEVLTPGVVRILRTAWQATAGRRAE